MGDPVETAGTHTVVLVCRRAFFPISSHSHVLAHSVIVAKLSRVCLLDLRTVSTYCIACNIACKRGFIDGSFNFNAKFLTVHLPEL